MKPDLPSFKRVAAYVRVSNLKDAMLQSLSTQVSYYNDFIQHHPGWQFAGVYVDVDTRYGHLPQKPMSGCFNSRPPERGNLQNQLANHSI